MLTFYFEELPHPTYPAAAPEYERNVEDMEYFNAGVLVMNIQGMKEKYEEFILKMKIEKETYPDF